jgi:hypothetical protein
MSPSFAGTRQLTSHDTKMISVASRTPIRIPVPLRSITHRHPRSGNPT